MQFKPASEQELAEAALWPDGTIAACEIVAAEEGLSKSTQQPMLTLTARVTDPTSGRQQRIYYYLPAGLLERLYNAASAFGLRAQYDAGSLDPADFLNKTAKARIGIERHPTGAFAPRNVIRSFVVPHPPAVASYERAA